MGMEEGWREGGREERGREGGREGGEIHVKTQWEYRKKLQPVDQWRVEYIQYKEQWVC